MKIHRVRAHEFGKLNGELDLAPGMTVIHGDNEAGKSTWLQAIFAALCGRRRGRGANTLEEREFERQYKPWSGGQWRATVKFELDDGRRIEIQQRDLDTKESVAQDAETGRPIGDEIIYSGSIDGSRFLGLNRQVMPSTLVIGQGDIQRLRQKSERKGDEASALQEELQRAAASAGGAATAVEALRTLREYASEEVGLERRNSTKPLQRSIELAAAAREALGDGRSRHNERIRLENELSAARDWARGAETRVRTCQGQLTQRKLERLNDRLARIDGLTAKFPDGAAPTAPGEEPDAGAARELREAAEAFRWRPRAPAESAGPSADEMAAQLAQLPEAPDGDSEVAAEVATAARSWRAATEARTLREQLGLGEAPVNVLAKADEARAKRALAILELPPAESLDEAERRVQELIEQVEEPKRRLEKATPFGRWPAIGAVAGSLLLVLGTLDLVPRAVGVAGVLLMVACYALIYLGQKRVGLSRSRPVEEAAVGMDLADARADLRDLKRKQKQRDRQFEAARRELESLGLGTDADDVRDALTALRERETWEREHAFWQTRLEAAREAEATAETALRTALADRGVEDPDALVGILLETYEGRCRRNAELASGTGRREALESRLEAQRQSERIAATREASERRFRAALDAVGLPTDSDEDAELWAGSWLENRERRLQERRHDWDRLQRLLDGTDRQTLAAQRDAVARERTRTGDSITDETDELRTLGDAALERMLAEARVDAEKARLEVNRHEVRLAADADLPSLAELEEEHAAAEREVDLLRRASGILDKTRGHLEAAQDEVHRMLAPDLREKLEKRLSLVTNGRYSAVRIDPEEGMEVQLEVEDGVYRSATELSHGTVDQTYLLLRIGLAEALGDKKESAPLFLDDATVHSDTDRTSRFLDLLLALSDERQIVVFSQEQEVRQWAAKRLVGDPRNRLIELGPDGLPLRAKANIGPAGADADQPAPDPERQHSLL